MKILALIAILLNLTSCSQELHVNPSEEIRYNKQTIFNLNVADYQIINNNSSNISQLAHLLPHSFNALIKIWAHDNIKSANKNSEQTLKIVIKDSNVNERFEKDVNGDDLIIYETKLKIAFEIYNKNNLLMPSQDINIDLTNSRSVSKKSSPEEHQLALYLMQKELMDDFNTKARFAISQSFAKLVILQ